MKIVTDKIKKQELKEMAEKMFGNLVKVVVDIEKGVMAIDGELHADEEGLLLENGSRQENLWGINIYPDLEGDDKIEFDSMINVRPRQNNMSRGIEDDKIRAKILEIVNRLIEK